MEKVVFIRKNKGPILFDLIYWLTKPRTFTLPFRLPWHVSIGEKVELLYRYYQRIYNDMSLCYPQTLEVPCMFRAKNRINAIILNGTVDKEYNRLIRRIKRAKHGNKQYNFQST